jgi:RNA-directed DNA polymerase
MTTAQHRRWLATGLAHAFLADHELPGGCTPDALLARAKVCLGCEGAPPEWLVSMAQAVATRWAQQGLIDTVDSLAQMLVQRPEWSPHEHDEAEGDEDAPVDDTAAPPEPVPLEPWTVRHWLLRPVRMAALPWGLQHIERPDLPTTADWAQWLGITPDRLLWLTHPSQRWREGNGRPHATVAHHYHHRLLPKRSGGLRLLEAPKAELKQVQRVLLQRVLTHLPTHEAAHGFVRNRSVHTHALVHAAQPCVISFDLRDFFPSIGAARIHAFWRSWGYPEDVAQMLTQLCTTRTPASVRERLRDAQALDFPAARRLASPHLPQGAPTSPALANLCAFGLDLRMEGLAQRFGARYSRYADDLVFSGPASLAQRFRQLHAWVDAIAADEGFALHPGKRRRMLAHQQQRITGLVVNAQPHIAREDYDRLRAELHGAAQAASIDSQHRAHLQGRVAWACQALAPSRAAKLKTLLARIPA